ncbi:MAG: hypothetical protein C0467_19105 [Planctomycetaceae bacterium]|nr:hypothetical protein [Planctomycetaceae bacterium]
MKTTTMGTDFLTLIEDTQLLSAKQLAEYRTAQAQNVPATELATRLIRDRMLTPFQAKVLLKGKPQNFFLTTKYKILDHLGTGGMGRVYLCEHLILERLVAVKILTVNGATGAGATTGQGLIERFYREARAVAALDHRNIIRVFDVEQTRGAPFMVMEYVDGIDLDKYVSVHGPLESNRAAEYVRQAAEGLEHAHQAGLIHRDIKPSNFLLDRAGGIRLLDLGLARFLVDSRRNQGVTELYDANVILGTVDYMAPEQAIDSSQVDIRADIYSLGCTLYFLLTGKVVFESEAFTQKMLAHQMRDPIPIRQRRPEVPAGLEAVAKLMMAKKPENRIQTPGEVAEALREFAVPAPGLPDTARMPKVSARSFRLGLCPAPTAIRSVGSSGSMQITPKNGLRAGSSGAISVSADDTLADERETLSEPAEVEEDVEEETEIRPRAGVGIWLVVGALLLAVIVAGVFWPSGAPPVAVVPPPEVKPTPKPPQPVKPPASAVVVSLADAASKIGERVTVQYTVGSIGGKVNVYLNSNKEFTAKDNFAVVLSPKVQVGKWEKPTPEQFVGKTIRATGVIKMNKDIPQLDLLNPQDLEIVN